MDRQLPQTALPCQSSAGEHFRTHYGAPGADRPLPDVQRRIDVRAGHMAARNALEGGLVGSVLLVDAPTGATFTRGVAGIDEDNRHTSALRFVNDEAAELGECPVTKPRSLIAASGRNPCADALQILQGQAACGAFSIQNERLRNHVVRVLLVSPLLSGQFAQTAFGGLGSARLQSSPPLGEIAADALDTGAGVRGPVAIDRERDEAEINAKPVLGFEPLGFWNVAGRGEHPLAPHEAEIDLSFAIGHQSLLVLTHRDRHNHTTLDRPDTHSRAIFDEADNSIVIGLCSVGTEMPLGVAVQLVGVGDLGNAPYDGLRGQAEPGPRLDIADLVKCVLPERGFVPRQRRQPVARGVALFERGLQALGLTARRKHLEGSNELHALKYRVSFKRWQERQTAFAPLSLCRLLRTVSRGVN